MISATIVLDSINPNGDRLTTMEVVMPRIILAEFNTHRKFSRNSASSRAVSVKKKIEEALKNPFVPIKWTQNENGFHKQICNRLLEPFLWHTVLVSSTEWNNFFLQRCSPLAEPHMEMVANSMKKALEESTPFPIPYGCWHLPFLTSDQKSPKNEAIKVSAARCARVSYQRHGTESSWEDDLRIGQLLLDAAPPHHSPFEHIAKALEIWEGRDGEEKPLGNFDGWEQARHLNF